MTIYSSLIASSAYQNIKPSQANYDRFIFGVTVPELQNTYRIALHYGLNEQIIININTSINNKFDAAKLKNGDTIYLPKGTIVSNNVAGDLNSSKIIRMAWTMDDGPRQGTTLKMIEVLARRKAVTWFIMKNRIKWYGESKAIELYKNIVDNGGEIGIHSFHPALDHTTWFNTTKTETYPTMTDAMNALENFNNYLIGKGIVTKFVRPPYGLLTEIELALNKKGFTNGSITSNAMARKIIANENITNSKALEVKDEFILMKNRLIEMGLHLGIYQTIGTQDWNAESSPSDSLADDITLYSKKLDKGYFEKEAKALVNDTSNTPRNIIILAHDTASINPNEVLNDIKQTEYYASYTKDILAKKSKELFNDQPIPPSSKNGIKIEYHTMSSLFKKVRGINP
jgi:peptidoglycan/xylan/chitin deacetylase (PgdA/CDA1 family)